MKKTAIALLVLVLCVSTAYARWDKTLPASTSDANQIGVLVPANNEAVDLLLSNYRRDSAIVYATADTLTVNAGEIVCSNSDGSVRLMAKNASSTSVAWTDIDTGSEASSTTYYVYAVMAATTDTTFTCKISLSSTAPSGATYYKRLGSFYNSSASSITLINNDDNASEYADVSSKTINVAYQAFTDGEVVSYCSITDAGASKFNLLGYSDLASTPTTILTANSWHYIPNDSSSGYCGVTFPVKKGDYWQVTSSGTGLTSYKVYWVAKQ